MPAYIDPMLMLPQDVAPAEAETADISDLDEELGTPEPSVKEDGFLEQADGSVLVTEENDQPRDPEFDENLADWLPPEVTVSLGRELCELVDGDKEDRKDRDSQYAEGIKRTGLVKNKSVGADFDGASSVTHPMLAKGCVDFASKAIKELFPSSGPVRTQIIGDQDDVKLERAERKKTYMNWQLTEQVPEHRSEFEKMLSQLPLGGSQYKRWWYDQRLGRPRTCAVYIDDIFLPFDQNDFYTTPRLTHREFIGAAEFKARVASALYLDDDVTAGDNPDRSESDKAARDVEGVADESAIYSSKGGTREMYTIYADLELEDDPLTQGELSPYILHVSEYGGTVLGLYRNWNPEDKRRLRLHWIVEYNFIPWRGAYAVGLAHLIGSLSVASTGALNALLDSAHINNFPGGLKLKGGRTSGQTLSVNATELREIDAPPGVDDIRKLVMAFPFNGPSTVLYTLLEFLTQQAEVVVSTASEKIAEAGANMPMGTALALIEGGSTNFSAIHARLHHSARKELEILHRLDSVYLDDSETVKELGELVVYRKDFQGPMDVLPVSDPNIFSEAQRYAQLQAVMQLETMPEFKPFFKPERLLVRALRLLQIPYAEDIANLPRDPRRLIPVEENSAAANEDGPPLKVYEEQDDMAHLESHVMFMTSPLLGSSPLVGAVALPKLLKHCREHLVSYYRKHHIAAAHAFKAVAHMQGHTLDESTAQSKGHAYADRAMAQQLSTMVAPGLEKALTLAAQFAPKPPADGNVQATLAAQAALEAQKLQVAQQDNEVERKFKANESALERQAKAAESEAVRAANAHAASIAARIEQMQAASDKHTTAMTLMVQTKLAEASELHKEFLAQQKAENDAELLVLKQLLLERTPDPAAQPAWQAEIDTLMQTVTAALQANAQQATEQLAQHGSGMNAQLEQFAKSQAAPRGAHLLKDAEGNTLGAQVINADGTPGRRVRYLKDPATGNTVGIETVTEEDTP